MTQERRPSTAERGGVDRTGMTRCANQGGAAVSGAARFVGPVALSLTTVVALASCLHSGSDEPAPGNSVPQVRGQQDPGSQDRTEAVEAPSAYALAAKRLLPERGAMDFSSLHNVFVLSDQVISGSEPLDETAFAQLQQFGVRTLLSVDGKVPDAEMAARFGMRYVHVPIQYTGIEEHEQLEIAKTFRELEGPFFVHCFHGKHRGPAAAALGRLVLDGAEREIVLAEMRQWCGTSSNYEGLYRTIAECEVPSEDETRALEWDFPAAHALGGFRAMMSAAPRMEDHLELLADRDWQLDPEHPDIDAVQEATQLADAFQQSMEMDEVRAEPEHFRDLLARSTERSVDLRDALIAMRAAAEPDAAAQQGELAQEAFTDVQQLCVDCHRAYRNRR